MRHLSASFPQKPAIRRAEKIHGNRIWLQAGGLLLLFAVAALSTLAKNSQYYPHRSETRFVNIASKMNAAKSPVVLEQKPVQLLWLILPPPLKYSESFQVESPLPAVQLIGLLVSPLRRPPPEILA